MQSSVSIIDVIGNEGIPFKAGAVVEALRLANAVKSLKSQIHLARRTKEEGHVKQQII